MPKEHKESFGKVMKIVLKILNSANVPHEKVKNVIYFSLHCNSFCFYYNMFKMGDYFQFDQFAKLNFNIYVKRIKLNKEQLQKQIREDTYYFIRHFHPLFPK